METKATIISVVSPDFDTVTPWVCTACGSRLIAACSWFCTCCIASLGSVPASKVSVTVARPVLVLCDDIYIMLSRPVMFCSIIWVTVFSSVCAEAPG
ncbi:hypothetical protein D3C71_2047470 [compost metagenome]